MKGAERLVAACFGIAGLAGVGLTVVYVLGGHPQLEGALLAASLGGLGMGLMLWATRLLPVEEMVEEIEVGTSLPVVRAQAEQALERGGAQLTRRRLLVRLFGAAVSALGIAALFPIRSLGPRPGRSLLQTAWAPGVRVVTGEGSPLRVEHLQPGSVVTAFPEGHVGSADAQVLVIRVRESDLQLPAERRAWAPGGAVAYSKVCTHAGCPVGLYRAETAELICPCHQSTFNVLRGAEPVFGPAARPLPQLPLRVDDAGELRAVGDFLEPIGPGFWDRG